MGPPRASIGSASQRAPQVAGGDQGMGPERARVGSASQRAPQVAGGDRGMGPLAAPSID
jgi:hypothetical protein